MRGAWRGPIDRDRERCCHDPSSAARPSVLLRINKGRESSVPSELGVNGMRIGWRCAEVAVVLERLGRIREGVPPMFSYPVGYRMIIKLSILLCV